MQLDDVRPLCESRQPRKHYPRNLCDGVRQEYMGHSIMESSLRLRNFSKHGGCDVVFEARARRMSSLEIHGYGKASNLE